MALFSIFGRKGYIYTLKNVFLGFLMYLQLPGICRRTKGRRRSDSVSQDGVADEGQTFSKEIVLFSSFLVRHLSEPTMPHWSLSVAGWCSRCGVDGLHLALFSTFDCTSSGLQLGLPLALSNTFFSTLFHASNLP